MQVEFSRHQGSERKSSCDLEGPRSPRSERLTNPLGGKAERRRTRQGEVIARQISEVKNIEAFGDDAEFISFLEPERLLDAKVLRREVVTEVVMRRQRDFGEYLSRCKARYGSGRGFPRQVRVVLIDQVLQIPLAKEAVEFMAWKRSIRSAGREVRAGNVNSAYDRLDGRPADDGGDH